MRVEMSSRLEVSLLWSSLRMLSCVCTRPGCDAKHSTPLPCRPNYADVSVLKMTPTTEMNTDYARSHKCTRLGCINSSSCYCQANHLPCLLGDKLGRPGDSAYGAIRNLQGFGNKMLQGFRITTVPAQNDMLLQNLEEDNSIIM